MTKSNTKKNETSFLLKNLTTFLPRLVVGNHKKWITVALLGKFITGISIIYKWYSLPSLFYIKKVVPSKCIVIYYIPARKYEMFVIVKNIAPTI